MSLVSYPCVSAWHPTFRLNEPIPLPYSDNISFSPICLAFTTDHPVVWLFVSIARIFENLVFITRVSTSHALLPPPHHFRNDLSHPSLVRWLKLRTQSWFPLAYKKELQLLHRTQEPVFVQPWPVSSSITLRPNTPSLNPSQTHHCTHRPCIDRAASCLPTEITSACVSFPILSNVRTPVIPSLVTSSKLWQGLHAWPSVLSCLCQNPSSLVFKWAFPRGTAATGPA